MRDFGYKGGSHDGSMVRNNLETIHRTAKNLQSQIQSNDRLPLWTVTSINSAQDQLSNTSNYLESRMSLAEQEASQEMAGFFENVANWVEDKKENLEDALTARTKRRMEEEKGWHFPVLSWATQKKSDREASLNEYTFYVDPRFYKVVCDNTGCYVGDTRVFIGDPDMFDWYNALTRYEETYGIPVDYLTMTKHYESIPMPNVGAKKELRVGSSIKQKIIPNTPAHILKKVKSVMVGEREYLKEEVGKFEKVQRGQDNLSRVLNRFVDGIKTTPLGILMAITEFQLEMIVEFLATQIVDYDLLISQVDSALSRDGMQDIVDSIPEVDTPKYTPSQQPQYSPAPSMTDMFDQSNGNKDVPSSQKPTFNPWWIVGGLGIAVVLAKSKRGKK